MGQKKEVPVISGIQVLDRAVFILSVIADQPRNLTDLCEITGLPRATAHRIAVALEKHRLIARDAHGMWTTGPALAEMAPTTHSHLEDAAEHILPKLQAETGESVQLYRISGTERVCIANANPSTGLHDIVPVGHRMSLHAGSAAKVLMAYAPDALLDQILPKAVFTEADLEEVRTSKIAESSAERDPSLASASVPVFDATGAMIAALSTSGPVERMGAHPAKKFGPALRRAAKEFGKSLKG